MLDSWGTGKMDDYDFDSVPATKVVPNFAAAVVEQNSHASVSGPLPFALQ